MSESERETERQRDRERDRQGENERGRTNNTIKKLSHTEVRTTEIQKHQQRAVVKKMEDQS